MYFHVTVWYTSQMDLNPAHWGDSAFLPRLGRYLGSQNVLEWWKYIDNFRKSRGRHIYHWDKINGEGGKPQVSQTSSWWHGGKPGRADLQKILERDSETREDIMFSAGRQGMMQCETTTHLPSASDTTASETFSI